MKILEYEEQEGDIIIITRQYGIHYELCVFKSKEDALADLYNIAKLKTIDLLHCSDWALLEEHCNEMDSLKANFDYKLTPFYKFENIN